MKTLNPTLWRTCRVLAGVHRLELLRLTLLEPGQNVSQMAKRLGIGISDASQELRRLQSRGLLRRTCQGRSVTFMPIPDPQVPTAAPLLEVLKAALLRSRPDLAAFAGMAHALGHERRIALATALRTGPLNRIALATHVHSCPETIDWHVKTMLDGGLVVREGQGYALNPNCPPFLAALLRLIQPPE